jgi:hypothetical protein
MAVGGSHKEIKPVTFWLVDSTFCFELIMLLKHIERVILLAFTYVYHILHTILKCLAV